MGKMFFDYDDGDFAFSISDNMGMDSDGNMMMRLSDNMAMDVDSGDIHMTSSWSANEDDDQKPTSYYFPNILEALQKHERLTALNFI